jgi:transcriptional repressor NrdR
VRCPFCSFEDTRVVDTRTTEPGGAVRRRRECAGCGDRFTTYERIEEAPVTVVKRDGRRERFDRQKLLRGLVRASNKRPVSDEQLEELAESIAAEVRAAGASVSAELVGDLAERGLARLDPVSAIQFASVYRNLADLDELEAVVRRFKEEPIPGAGQLALDPSGPQSKIARSPRGAPVRAAERRDHVGQP